MNVSKKIFTIILAFTACFTFSQSSDSVSIKLKDFHSSEITDVILTKDESFFISSDVSGKILMYNTLDYGFVKTLRKATGIPVQNMRLVVNDSILIFNQKFDYGDASKDSLIGVRVFDQKVIYKNQISGNFIDRQDNVIIGESKNEYLHVLEIFDNRLNKITSAYSTYNVKVAAVSNDLFSVAFVGEEISRQVELKVVNTKTAEEEIALSIPENNYLAHLFFDRITNNLYALLVHQKNNTIAVYNISKNKNFNNPLFLTDFYFDRFVNVSSYQSEGNYKIVFTRKGSLPNNPFVIEKKNDKFYSFMPNYKEGVTRSVYLKSKNEFVFFEPFVTYSNNVNCTSTLRFNVFDNKNKIHKNTYPKGAAKFYSGTFLPNGNWMVVGNELNSDEVLASYKYRIKYFETGTFNNRFGKLDFSNYLEVKHKTKEFTTSTFMFDKSNGVHPFYGYKIGNENTYAFYKYDFIKDQISKIADEHPKYKSILDYNNKLNYLLLSKAVYYNRGYTEPQEFALVQNKDIKLLNGKFKFGKLSNSGTYLLTINANNKAEIRTTDGLKIIFEKQLTDGSYKVFKLDENEFGISISFNAIDIDKCNKESLTISFDAENKSFNSNTLDCLFFTDITFSNEKIGLIVEDFGVLLNNDQLQFFPSEFPESISLNDDASKLMISFNNGKISIYDTNSLKANVTMLHPDEKSQVFLDEKGNYFSNTNPDDYLIAFNNNKRVNFNTINDQFYNPEEILSQFGQPNNEYLTTLKEALKIRSKNNESIYQKSAIQNNEKPQNIILDDPNMYVLAVGVSDYIQSDFNLTFADKDALDIAKIYGILDQKTLDNYNTKFYGTNYSLADETGDNQKSLKKYLEQYKNIGGLYAINADRTLWLEHDYGKYFIWDFNLQTTEAITLPNEFKISEFEHDFDKIIFINPDNTGFYMRASNGENFSYDFKSKLFTKITLPFKIDYSITPPESLIPLSQNRWAYFNYLNNEATLSIGNVNSNTIDNTIKFNINKFNKLDSDGLLITSTEDFYTCQFNGVSRNGNFLFYSTSAESNELFFVDLTAETIIPLLVKIKEPIGYSPKIYCSEDGKFFSILDEYADDFKYKLTSYSVLGELINTSIFKDKDLLDFGGISFFNNKPVWIKKSRPLVSQETYDSSSRLLSQNKPYSFKNSFVKYLTNENANSEKIKEELISFFKNVKPNDQVIVFLAGHGVLDKELNYYFAPYDMDFNNVSKNGVSLNVIIESLKECQSDHKLLLMDSCHSGNTLDMTKSEVVIVDDSKDPSKRGSKSKSTSTRSEFKVSDIVSTLFEDFLSTSGITIISASSGEDVAYEHRELGNGAFTSSYVNLLKEKLKGNNYTYDEASLQKSVDITNETIEELLKEVMIITKGKQVPDLREVNKNSKLKMW
ncbi:hypothetical protein SAMN06265371_10794 [Lutibacter agarilyticus]|uniref:Caspase domain-containing protein n=1 Tax=Lutibacter agarilyticus TaxID=1109740 RepID=A0A238XWL9_9FLAO|nr:caspase family protein [Lutibacter agarilyticus]SNR62968.1 hypothetical protein SAMN06265371_10794 [Lutibacter agarilyticus]